MVTTRKPAARRTATVKAAALPVKPNARLAATPAGKNNNAGAGGARTAKVKPVQGSARQARPPTAPAARSPTSRPRHPRRRRRRRPASPSSCATPSPCRRRNSRCWTRSRSAPCRRARQARRASCCAPASRCWRPCPTWRSAPRSTRCRRARAAAPRRPEAPQSASGACTATTTHSTPPRARARAATTPRPCGWRTRRPRPAAAGRRPGPASAGGPRPAPAAGRRATARRPARRRHSRPGASSSRTLNLRPSASAVCSQRRAGLHRMRVSSRQHAVEPRAHAGGLLLAPRRQRALAGRPAPRARSSASAWRHRIRSMPPPRAGSAAAYRPISAACAPVAQRVRLQRA